MPASKAERAILQRRRAAASGAVLVPLLEKILEHEVFFDDQEDVRFLEMLVQARRLPRRKGVFSPSMLGSCLRQAFFARRNEPKLDTPDSQANAYFLTGNFTHLKLQFAMWKAHRAGLLELMAVPIKHELLIVDELCQTGAISNGDHDTWSKALNFYGDGTRPGVEVRVVDGDYGGTIDVLPILPFNLGDPDEDFVQMRPAIVDFKGINVVDYQRTIRDGAKPAYRKQIVGYAKTANKVLGLDIENCLLVSECKAGPITGRGSVIALHETHVSVEEWSGEEARRLRTLRHYHANDELPAIECVSTQHMGFQGCPFRDRCRDEVLVVQRERERRAREESKNAKPARSRRS